MLDNITKKNIDDCRDVLVGKVPDPKSQIEQITLALIYKFMDDMDKESVEKFKGKAKFFSGEYAKYGWRKLFDPLLNGQEMLALYSEALEKLNTNPNIPELFRNIFKNAYLPYRDPSTLKLFLKYINEFEYSHSEKLGDAFEYLLSVMGSQGDAGQFRTPRHIIDFVTACVNPQKNETVLDPACGTAGFLLSAFKHVLNQNTEKRQGDKLKPEDRKKLATNFVGYDISPDMVRLSLANMYLHGFATPLIHEYDSLSSEDRWQETFDVILANPPFMTPKGGIRPHKKFGVQANKAEVLFTDYIAEHLNSNGRAGIVVPNGIVATSQTAYKQLRKMLVQDSLIAVISLPAGVFQPYSGVKTSVLILDKRLAKKSQHILFLKIENDGFDLGTQRRGINKNDLPSALQTLKTYKQCLNNDKPFEDLPTLATLIEKKMVLGNKDFVLIAERYLEAKNQTHSSWETKKLSEITTSMHQGINTAGDKIEFEMEGYPIIQTRNISSGDLDFDNIKYLSKEHWDKYQLKYKPKVGDVLLTNIGTIGKSIIVDLKMASIDFLIHWNIFKISCSLDLLMPQFLKYCLDQLERDNYYANFQKGGTVSFITKAVLSDIEIPLPPLEIQEQIVTEIEGYQKIIDGAKQIVNNYKPTISIQNDWKRVELRTLAKNLDGKRKPVTKGDRKEGKYPYYGASGIVDKVEDYIFDDTLLLISEDGANLVSRVYPIAFTATGKFWVNNHAHVLKFDNLDLHRYVEVYINQIDISKKVTGSAQPKLNQSHLNEILIPIPSPEEQHTIVKAIEEELKLVNANKRLIEIFEQKIKTKIGEVWGVKKEETLSMAAEPQIKYK
jgi:type I restriction enzyme M protein